MVFTLIVALALAVLSVIFALQNPGSISAEFFSLKMHGPLALFMLAGIGIGIVIGILVMIPNAIKNTIAISRHRKHIDGLEKSLKEQQAQVQPPAQITKPEASAPAPAPEQMPQIEETPKITE
jgi:uncharacterized integral membrane protein